MRLVHERFQVIFTALSDQKELAKVLELYSLKCSTAEQMLEVNKAYYCYVLDAAWASEMHESEAKFWGLLGLLLEHGHKVKSSFWLTSPLSS